MKALLLLAKGFATLNGSLLAVGRWLGMVCMALMVVIILAQVFWRYVLDNALPWPEEAARFLMVWAAGLMAATAFRRGGFVSIDMLVRFLPKKLASLLNLLLMMLCLLILWVAIGIAWKEVTGLGGRFEMDALRYPVGWGEWVKVPRSAQMASMLVGVALLILVAVELSLRSIIEFLGRGDDLPIIPEAVSLGAD